MIRVLKLKGMIGRWTTPSFLWTENETLTVKLDVSETRVGRYIAVVTCGTQKIERRLGQEMTIEIHSDFIKAGNFNPVSILLEYRNKQDDYVIIPNDPKKGGFFIEPLYIERVTENTTAIAWLTKIETEIAEIKATQADMANKLQKFEDEGVPLLAEEENEEIIEGE